MTLTTFALVSSLLTIVASLPAGVYIGDKGQVGASWGGYSASAGLGGILTGAGGAKGGLHAEAGTPHGHFASAGLGGQVGGNGADGGYGIASAGSSASSSSSGDSSFSSGGSSSSAGVQVTKPNNKNTFFDDVFNIPQSVLRSVNDLLNQKRGGGVNTSVKTHASAHSHAGVSTRTAAIESSSADASSVAAVGAGVESNHIQSGTKYDAIFAIPQSALSAVAKLLNRGWN